MKGRPLAYLDNGATSQKPRAVIDALTRYYEQDNSNVHRGVHTLSERATAAYEGTREKVRTFLNAADTREIVFARGTTEAINLVANSFVRPRLREGDEIVISHMEHHSNIVPWQFLCEDTGAKLRVVPIDDDGALDLPACLSMLGPRTRFVSMTWVANSLGTINPVREIVEAAHRAGAPVMLDAAQAVPHLAVDVQALGCDFLAFSAHKVCGPTGIGALYGKLEHLEAMTPWQAGGDMILAVTFEKTTWNAVPYRFEAGTPNIADTIAMGVGLDYVHALGARPGGRLRTRPPRLRHRGGCGRSPGFASSATRGRSRAFCRSWSRGCTRTTWGPFSTAKGWRCGPDTTVRCRSWPGSTCRRWPAPRSPSTIRARKLTRWSQASTRCATYSARTDEHRHWMNPCPAKRQGAVRPSPDRRSRRAFRNPRRDRPGPRRHERCPHPLNRRLP